MSFVRATRKAQAAVARAPIPKSVATVRVTHEMIAERAKTIWQAKGCPEGQDEQNWKEAEAQLKKELGC
ncbi:MAG: DUF2934 domain-containing protein [Phycisphaerae bacterium]